MDLNTLTRMVTDLRDYCQSFHPVFGRREPRETFDAVVLGLITPAERKNGWQLAELAGDDTPDIIHRFFTSTKWEVDELLNLYQQRLLETFGRSGALIFDETGFPKKGSSSVGVQRQYSGTLGKIGNCQIGVFAAWITPYAHTLFDRRLFMPKDWLADPARRAKTHVPESLVHHSKPQLAAQMLEHALTQGAQPQWVGGDTIYGDDTALRQLVASHGLDYAFAVACKTQVWLHWPKVEEPEQVNATRTGRGQRLQKRRVVADEPRRVRVDEVARSWPQEHWQQLSCGAGSKGERLYYWGVAQVVEAHEHLPSRRSWLIVRQNGEDLTTRAYFLCYSPRELPLQVWLERVGTRWPIEQCFEEAKSLCGLDEYEVRTWPGWHRHITLSMVAHHFLAEQRLKLGQEQEVKKPKSTSRKTRCTG